MIRTQAGDRQALACLIARHHRDLYAYYARIAGNRILAEDLTQECFLRLIRGAPRFDPARPFRPWLYRVAVNLWRDHLRNRTRAREFASSDVGPDPLDQGPSVEDQVAGRLLADSLGATVRALPPETAQILVLRFCHDLRVREIAQILGIREGTVKSRLFYGLRRLKSSLASKEVPVVDQAVPAVKPG